MLVTGIVKDLEPREQTGYGGNTVFIICILLINNPATGVIL
jgi:hypothetical protein